jgi:hypothetical protein
MRVYTLQRLESNDTFTLGHLLDDESKVIACTLELPWRGNQHDISCVPAGTYQVAQYNSPEHGFVVPRLLNVPDRAFSEMHPGCLPRDTKGCILLGARFGQVDYADGKPDASGYGLLDSRSTFDAFMKSIEGIDEFTLIILDPEKGQ